VSSRGVALLVRRLLVLLYAVEDKATGETRTRSNCRAESRVSGERSDNSPASGPDHRAARGTLLSRRHVSASGNSGAAKQSSQCTFHQYSSFILSLPGCPGRDIAASGRRQLRQPGTFLAG
jgi:hypothetical protein